MKKSTRRAFLAGAAATAATAVGLGLADEPILHDAAPVPPLASSRFRSIYGDPAQRARFLSFLEHVFHVVPPTTLDAVIAEGCRRHGTDRAIYAYIQRRLPEVTPALAALRYALPALRAQRAEMARQTARLLEGRGRPESYVEIGTPGRYVGSLREAVGIGDEVYLVHDVEPGYGPTDVVERGRLAPAGEFVALDSYAPITRGVVPKGRVDLVTNYIGLHHAPRGRLEAFVASIHEALRPGGTFVLRDHDVQSRPDDTFVALAHDVFNAGTHATWAKNDAELRFFLTIEATEELLARHGFRRLGPRLAQSGDPTKNLLVAFERT